MMRFGSLPGARFRRAARERIVIETGDCAVYAIGDVHGCLKELLELEAMIVADSAGIEARKLIVMLGDYVDRGPLSSQVLDHLIAAPPAGFERICLLGNHEMAMLDFLEGGIALKEWLGMGALPTLVSYGMDYARLCEIYRSDGEVERMVRATIPAAHREFLRALPIMATLSRFIFVHAGIRPDLGIDKQADEDLVTIRSEFYERTHLLKHYVVHGHTPVGRATRYGPRINIDTGAYSSGRLTALRIWDRTGRFIATGDEPAPSA
jgi:serine/threonine protein phosphatase 1